MGSSSKCGCGEAACRRPRAANVVDGVGFDCPLLRRREDLDFAGDEDESGAGCWGWDMSGLIELR